MIRDLGIVTPGTTLYLPWHTFDSNDPSASVAIAALAVTDIEIYKDGSTTQRASDNGYTLLDTDGIDFDGVVGIGGISVDLADNSTAGFYAAGSRYWVVIGPVTVDAAAINFVLATFRIGYPPAILNTTIATLSTQTSFTLTVGPAEDDALNGMWCVIHDVASAVQLGHAVILDYTGSTKTVTLAAGTTFTAAATDNIAIMGPMPVQPTVAGRTLDVSTGGEAGVDWANVGSQSTSVNLSATTTNLVNTVTTYTNNTLQTGDSFARLGAPAGASVSADIAAIEAQTDDIGTAGAGLTAVPWNASWDAEVQSEVADALAVFWTSPATLVDLIWDEDVDAAHQTAGTAGKKLDDAGGAADPWATALPGAYGAGTAGKIVGDNINAPLATIDTVVDAIKAVTDNLPNSGALTDISTAITTIDGIVDNILVDTDATIPGTLSTIAAYIDTEVAAIKAKTDNLPSDPADQSAVEAAITAAWTTALTEAYAANGVAFTPAQALYAIHQMLMQFSIAGTSYTVKQLDGSTTAFVVTLDDDTTPTAASRD